MTTPPSACVASTADSTMTRRSCSGSSADASASPKRAFASRSRRRSSSRSSSRPSSWAAIWLNARPSCANSSRPRTSTRSSSRPAAIEWAASANRPSAPTIERPARYATQAIRSSEPSRPTSRRPSTFCFSEAITELGVTAASINVLSGTSRAPIARYSRSPIVADSTRPGASWVAPETSGFEAASTCRCSSTKTSSSGAGQARAGVQPVGELRRQRHGRDDQRRAVARADERDRRLGRARRQPSDREPVGRLDPQRRRLGQQPLDRRAIAVCERLPGTPDPARGAPRPPPHSGAHPRTRPAPR